MSCSGSWHAWKGMKCFSWKSTAAFLLPDIRFFLTFMQVGLEASVLLERRWNLFENPPLDHFFWPQSAQNCCCKGSFFVPSIHWMSTCEQAAPRTCFKQPKPENNVKIVGMSPMLPGWIICPVLQVKMFVLQCGSGSWLFFLKRVDLCKRVSLIHQPWRQKKKFLCSFRAALSPPEKGR